MELNALHDPLTLDIIESGCVTWEDLVRSVRNFKYARNTSRTNFEEVWYQRRGTCSTKHGFLYQIAQINDFREVKLMLGVYLMTAENTPKVSKVLHAHGLKGVPEAHCYLRVGESYLDATTISSDYEHFKRDVLIEKVIQPEFLGAAKVEYHRNFLEEWMEKENITLTLDALWSIREECIQALTETS